MGTGRNALREWCSLFLTTWLSFCDWWMEYISVFFYFLMCVSTSRTVQHSSNHLPRVYVIESIIIYDLFCSMCVVVALLGKALQRNSIFNYKDYIHQDDKGKKKFYFFICSLRCVLLLINGCFSSIPFFSKAYGNGIVEAESFKTAATTQLSHFKILRQNLGIVISMGKNSWSKKSA